MDHDQTSCERFIAGLDDFLAGELDERENERSSHHLATCTDCASYLADYQATIDLAQGAMREPSPLPEDLIRSILASRRRN